MITSQIDPFTMPVAIAEIIITLGAAALLGYGLAKLAARSGLRLLKIEIENRQKDLAACRAIIAPTLREKKTAPPSPRASKVIYPTGETSSAKPDNLKRIEGIGPKIEEILNKNNINTYEALSETSPVRISAILKSAGPRYQINDPSSWPKQALLAKEGKWESLEEIRIKLISEGDG